MEITMEAPKKLKIDVIYDPTISLLGIYLECKLAFKTDTCTPMFIATLFIITKLWNLPRYLSASD
jgi:hypothetical protein